MLGSDSYGHWAFHKSRHELLWLPLQYFFVSIDATNALGSIVDAIAFVCFVWIVTDLFKRVLIDILEGARDQTACTAHVPVGP